MHLQTSKASHRTVRQALAQRRGRVYSRGMGNRLVHDTAFALATALTEKMDYKLLPAERTAFHRLVYETSKAALLRHDLQRDREADRLNADQRQP